MITRFSVNTVCKEYRNNYRKICRLMYKSRAKERAETRFEYACQTESTAGSKAWGPHWPASSPLLPPSQGLDSCPVFIAMLCSNPTARPLAHTSHHNVSFFLVPGLAHVMGPLYDYHRDASPSGPWLQGRW